MDWDKLTDYQLIEFLQLYKVTPQFENLSLQAEKIYNQVISQLGNNVIFTLPVIDLYIASNFKGNIPQKYLPETIRNLPSQKLQQFAVVFNLPDITPERLIRILNFLNALDLTSPIDQMLTEIDYFIALNLDYLSLIKYCKTSIKHLRICQDNSF